MDASHRCDPIDDPANTPRTRARVLRLLTAQFDGTDVNSDVVQVLHEIGSCTQCLRLALLMAAGVAAEALAAGPPDALGRLDTQLAEALDQIARGGVVE